VPLGFQVEIVPTPAAGKAHLIARLPATAPSGEKPLLLAGHEDVVGVEAPLWTVDPFAAVIRDGRL
jgi:acetylornithine deacetylase/succinyl-diaminopimelate desuccinylase-like protein